MVKERKNNVCVAVKRGVRVRWNCNVFNLAIENVLKGLPDKIRDQLSRYHTQIDKTKALQMYTFLNHRRWNRCSCIHKNDAELFFNVWHQLTKFSETGWPRSACNFMFPLRSRRNAIHRNSSRLSPSELVFSLGERREELMKLVGQAKYPSISL
jgi:hypothetical protein